MIKEIFSLFKWIIVTLYKVIWFLLKKIGILLGKIVKGFKRYDNKRKDFNDFNKRVSSRETEIY